MEIPIIDFEKCGLKTEKPSFEDLNNLGAKLYNAFATVGFVYLSNTGVPFEKVDEMNRTMKEFSDLEPETKKQYTADEYYHGYVSPEMGGINDHRPPDMKEHYNCGGRGFHRPNVNWPDRHVPGFSTIWKDFYEICRQIATRILDALSLGMNLKDKDYLKRGHSRMNSRENHTTLRALYYPPILDTTELEPGRIRLGEHSDFGSLSLVFQDGIGGLEVEDFDGNFVEATPIPGTILVNIGDAMQMWTEGRLKSTVHRIMIPEDEAKRRASRQTVAYFVFPDDEAVLSGLEFEDGSTPVRRIGDEKYRRKTYTAKEWTEWHYRKAHRAEFITVDK